MPDKPKDDHAPGMRNYLYQEWLDLVESLDFVARQLKKNSEQCATLKGASEKARQVYTDNHWEGIMQMEEIRIQISRVNGALHHSGDTLTKAIDAIREIKAHGV